MLRHSMPDYVFLNFCNYNTRVRNENIVDSIMQIERKMGLQPIHYYGFGPASKDIKEHL